MQVEQKKGKRSTLYVFITKFIVNDSYCWLMRKFNCKLKKIVYVASLLFIWCHVKPGF